VDIKSVVPGVFSNAQKTVALQPGDIIFSAGDGGTDMYGVAEGEIELRVGSAVLATLGPGEVFGEMALIANEPRSATAVATMPTTLAVIDRHRFLFLVQETPMFALQVMKVMASRIRAQNAAG